MALSLSQATTIATAAIAAARAEDAHALCVVVTDAGGCLRAALRTDQGSAFGPNIARAKALTALGFGRPSSVMARVFGDNPAVAAGLAAATGHFLPLAGGVPIHEQGVLVGAVGVAGSLPENDERFAIAGIKAAGLTAPD